VENNDLLYVKKRKKPQSYEYLNFSRNIEDGIETGLGVAVIIQIISLI